MMGKQKIILSLVICLMILFAACNGDVNQNAEEIDIEQNEIVVESATPTPTLVPVVVEPK